MVLRDSPDDAQLCRWFHRGSENVVLFIISHFSKNMWYVSFSLQFVSLSTIPSNSIKVAGKGKISSFVGITQ